MLLLTAGALVFGLLAWREAERARRTADILMKYYASFVGDKFVHADVSTSTVDQHVAALRRKLGDDADAPRLIETVYGYGYRLAS